MKNYATIHPNSQSLLLFALGNSYRQERQGLTGVSL